MRRIIFSKYSNERAKRFSLRTDISKDDNGNKEVYKVSMYPQGETHVENIYRWYQELDKIYKGTDISLNHCRKEDTGVQLEYLAGHTLEHILDEYLTLGRIQQCVDVLMDYLQEVKKGYQLEGFTRTEGFVEAFGDVDLSSDLLSGQVADIDMVLNNVIVDDGWKLIDYEWTFDFPVPYKYVAYRIIFYYLNGSSSRDILKGYRLMERADITAQEEEIFQEMEKHFQEVYILSEGMNGESHVPLRLLYEDITPGTIDLRTSVDFNGDLGKQSKMIQLYQSSGEAFSEETSEYQQCYREGMALNNFSVAEDTVRLRLDPCSRYCILRKLQIVWGERITRYQMNGIALEDGSLFFPVDDPQILIERVEQSADVFRIYFEIEYLTVEEAFGLLRKEQNKGRQKIINLQNSLRQREEQIIQMENTKVWKAYRKIKGQQ